MRNVSPPGVLYLHTGPRPGSSSSALLGCQLLVFPLNESIPGLAAETAVTRTRHPAMIPVSAEATPH
ncbi:hypothetical protein Y1Q_0002813 [Alligator mississippiensis]|uniref:Uncharacterized protein n=1 Tax=Alligator mississippiensis TaxID=8496 RepID=A0A151NZ85_ALLMI|nr:hypothetical protein Y1Q_0002813 [Alligator mississippiensis]